MLPGAPLSLQDPESAAAYAAAVPEMLPRAVQQLERLVSAAGKAAGGAAEAALPAAAAAASASAAVAQLWPLGQRPFLMQLLDSLERVPGAQSGW